ncbi:MAG: tRNA (cytidine(34)-2'-O)-methyltransferase [Pseudomonadota bacterium]
MFDVLLYEPEIPPNTGNVMRLCANTGSRLHLIKPLGFELDSRRLKRAGLDYRDLASVTVHENLADCLLALGDVRVFGFSTRGGKNYASATFSPGDALLFGPETRGLPDDVLYGLAEERRLRVPMLPDSRSLNLSNSVAVVVYEAWRQQAFSGGA